MRIVAFIALFAVLAAPASGAVYRWVDDNGVTHYSDEPGPGREKVEVAPLPTYRSTGVPPRRAPRGNAAGDEKFAGYDALVITQPANDATIRNNAGDVSVGVRVDPALRETDTIKVYLDGSPLRGGGRGTGFTLPNVDRGTHVLQVAIVDRAGQEVTRSSPVTFHLQRVSVNR